MLIARAESAAVEAKIVMATCSLMSEKGEYQTACASKASTNLTEWTGVHEPPEFAVRHLKFLTWIAGPRDDLLQYSAQDVRNDLNEQLTDEDSLGSEVLETKVSFR